MSYVNHIDNLDFKLGLYNQFCSAYSPDMEEGRAYGIALQAYDHGEPYSVVTVNVPSFGSDVCEFIGMKNAAYMDANNFPWVSEFVEKGIAVNTGFTKRSGFCEYPLYQFNENWLKSLKPIVADRTYDAYEKKYNSAMGIEEPNDNKTEQAKTMTVLEIAPGKEPKVIEIETGLESLQNAVGGLIRCVYPWENEAGIIVNEEGKIMGLPLNRALRDSEGNIYDIIRGTMLIVGLTEDNFGSLTSAQLEHYKEMFKEPETVFSLNRKFKAFPSSEKNPYRIFLMRRIGHQE